MHYIISADVDDYPCFSTSITMIPTDCKIINFPYTCLCTFLDNFLDNYQD